MVPNSKESLQQRVWAEVALDNIRHNVTELRNLVGPQVKLMAVVKANGYGHGAVPVTRAAIGAGADWVAVAIVEEGAALRKAGISAPILVLGVTPAALHQELLDYDLRATVCQWENVEQLAAKARAQGLTAKVHVKVDTGMGRLGLLPHDAFQFIRRAVALEGVAVEGVFTHFATAEEADVSYTDQQWQRFMWLLSALQEEGMAIPIRHAANSAAATRLQRARLGMVRCGLSIYGLYPSDLVRDVVALRPAMSLRARLSFSKMVPGGWGVSYGATYVTKQPTCIGVVPVGYGDGYSRGFSNNADVLIQGRRYPVVGRITMDQCMVDLGSDRIQPGEIVTLLGRDKNEEITADEWAERLGTISYEVLCSISERVPRVYLPPV